MNIARRFVSSAVVRHITAHRSRRRQLPPDEEKGLEEPWRTRAAPDPDPREPKAPAAAKPTGDRRAGAAIGHSRSCEVSGVVAVFDISGFSALCEKASQDESLMEELCRVINGAFSKEVELAERYGGEAVCFLGDGLLVFWPVRREAADAERMAAMQLQATRALQCALHTQEAFSSVCIGMGKDMRLRVAVAAGCFREFFCGIGSRSAGGWRSEAALIDARGHLIPGRMVHFMTGPAIEEAGNALGVIKAGETAACVSAQRFLPLALLASASFDARPEGPHINSARLPPPPRGRSTSDATNVNVNGTNGHAFGDPINGGSGGAAALPVVVPPALRPALDSLAAGLAVSLPASVLPAAAEGEKLVLDAEDEDAIALYVPYTVRARFDSMREWAAGSDAFDPTRFLSEFRLCSVLFLNLVGLDSSPEAVQRAVRTLQAVLYSYEGSLRQIVLDDKGLVMIAVFGLWPFAHEDDAFRAVACGVDMGESMRAMGVQTSVGITTGLVFCTFVGSQNRCEFSCFGTTVNRAARLMGVAKTGWEVYTDTKTYEVCRARIKMAKIGDFALKGIEERVPVYRPERRGGVTIASRSFASGGAEHLRNGLDGVTARSAEAHRVKVVLRAIAKRTSSKHDREASDHEAADSASTSGEPDSTPTALPHVLLFEGSSGSGKSVLCRHASHVAAGLNFVVATGTARENRFTSACFVWRSVMRGLFPLGSIDMGPLLESEADVEMLSHLIRMLQLDAPDALDAVGAPLAGIPESPQSNASFRQAHGSRPSSASFFRSHARKASVIWTQPGALVVQHAKQPAAAHANGNTMANIPRHGSLPPVQMHGFIISRRGSVQDPEVDLVNPFVPSRRGSMAGTRPPSPHRESFSSPQRPSMSLDPLLVMVPLEDFDPRASPYAIEGPALPRIGQLLADPLVLDAPEAPAATAHSHAQRPMRRTPAPEAAQSNSPRHSRSSNEPAHRDRGWPSRETDVDTAAESRPLEGLADPRTIPHLVGLARLPKREDVTQRHRKLEPSSTGAAPVDASDAGAVVLEVRDDPLSAREIQDATFAPTAVYDLPAASSELSTEYIARGVRALIAKLITRRAATGRPILLLLEDMHHADSLSWSVLADLTELVFTARAPVAAICTLRQPAPASFAARALSRLVEKPGRAERVVLGPVSNADLESLLCAAMRASRIPRAVRDFVRAQTDGLPFLIVDLARTLIENGSIQVDAGGEAIVKHALRRLKPTDGARVALMATLDRLTAAQAMTLKLAAVVGVHFTVAEVLAIHPGGLGMATFFSAAATSAPPAAPEPQSRALTPVEELRVSVAAALRDSAIEGTVRRELAALLRFGILREIEPHDGRATLIEAELDNRDGHERSAREYEFSQPLMQEVVYSLLPVTERRQLHLRLALFHEHRISSPSDGDGASSSEIDFDTAFVLAHNFTLANEPAMACRYLERCADKAFATLAYTEASRLYEDLIRLSEADPPPLAVRVRHMRCLAQAYNRVEMFKECADMCKAALALAGHLIPASRLKRRLWTRWNAVRVLLASPPSAPAYIASAMRARDRESPDLEAMNREVGRLQSTLIWMALSMEDQWDLNQYLSTLVAISALSAPSISEHTAVALARGAVICSLAGREAATIRWASLAWSVALEVEVKSSSLGGSPHIELWHDIINPLLQALVSTCSFDFARDVLRSLDARAQRSKHWNARALTTMLRLQFASQVGAHDVHPDGLIGVVSDLETLLALAAENADTMDNFQVTMAQAFFAYAQMMLGDASGGRAHIEKHLSGLLSGPRVSNLFKSFIKNIHASTVLWSLGPDGRTADGQTAARIALDGLDIARAAMSGSNVRLTVVVEYVFAAGEVLYHTLLSDPQRPDALAIPAGVLLSSVGMPASTPSQPAQSPNSLPAASELRAGLELVRKILRRAAVARVARPRAAMAAGMSSAARGDLRAARAQFERAARTARGAGQVRDEGMALLLQAAHTAAAGERVRLAGAAAALLSRAEDRLHEGVARACAASVAGDAAGGEARAGSGDPRPALGKSPSRLRLLAARLFGGARL